MSARGKPEDKFVILLPILLLLTLAITAHAGASSTPKNLVNSNPNSPNDNSNLTSLNQFQNEYQHRPSASKAASIERNKASTTTVPEMLPDLPSADFGGSPTFDYSYQDNRGTTNVPDCKGRLRLNGRRGFITDGSGFYQTNLQCSWLIDSERDNSTIRIQIHQFNTECNYDYLYIFDGDSIYSPLVASLSGDMKDFSMALSSSKPRNLISNQDNSTSTNQTTSTTPPLPASNTGVPSTTIESRPLEIRTNSGKAFVYFHSDTAQSMPGFYITYSIDSCPLDCSNRGECDFTTLACRCKAGHYGDACQYLLCPNNCTSLEYGICDKEKSCICNDGFFGPDCSSKIERQTWYEHAGTDVKAPARAFHQAIVVNNSMWVIGGKSQALSNTNVGLFRKMKTGIVFRFDLESRTWSDDVIEGMTGVNHLAELTGHSVVATGHKVFIYGGIAMNNTVLNALTVLDTKSAILSSLPSGKEAKGLDEQFTAPIAVTGHTANLVDSHMYIFLGYNPLFGYISAVQKLDLANNTWSIVEKKGSSVVGCIGHTSSYDPIRRLIYLYGGHHTHRSNNLYSFDPITEVWTLLQSGPSPRYHHSSLIIDRQLVVFGGNSYNTTHQSDQCFQQNYLTYDLSCSEPSNNNADRSGLVTYNPACGRKCWHSLEDTEPNILKRHGHSVVVYNKELILFGGFSGVVMNDVRFMKLGSCRDLESEYECGKVKLALTCHWNMIDSKCVEQMALRPYTAPHNATSELPDYNCSRTELDSIQRACDLRETCTDCLHTNLGCVWCSPVSRCQYGRCKSISNKPVVDPALCHRDDFLRGSLVGLNFGPHSLKDLSMGQDVDKEIECKRLDNCYLCHSKTQCSWQNDGCVYSPPSVITSPSTGGPLASQDDSGEHGGNGNSSNRVLTLMPNSSTFMQRLDPINRSFLAAFTTSLLNSSPNHSCDVPCYMRRSCNECTTTKCIWCSTTEQCIDSSAYFAYHAIGQCMHYVAHMLKCPIASCSDIETCDRCLTNPRCGWLNDISNTGKGRCIEGNSDGPSLVSNLSQPDLKNTSLPTSPILPNWHYTNCPSCQCNGHSYCKPNSSICVQGCQDNTEGLHCDRCITGYFGDPVNGGSCRACRCNGHAQTCNRETGKCYCSTKGVIGHNCNRCDDQNHYIGDPSGPNNGTCYYNLTTDYQYTFNMSKPEDHFYSEINFINVPLRRDSDVDFTIACSRLALINITSGTHHRNRRPIHTGLECGSFRLRFPQERHFLTETNFSFFVHVYKFQTPFILQIAFSQHRTLYLPQFFFTFSSCFLFFFALSGLVWKLKHEYDLYVRRQRQFIEMENMASRPFSTILLEVFKPTSEKKPLKQPNEPTPISFEPCFGSNVGVMSLFVQLPGRPDLAIGSALVSLNDDMGSSRDEISAPKWPEKGSPVQSV